ncbi:MAG TPA: AAA family ATPase [Rhodoblastus sp.]|nr:AAA family ATPase [Rhodoblastus sp.]
MRLRRLDLIRYGKFTDHCVDFGARAAGSPDLHIIYGPNEAGKSTLFVAWLDLLYGIGAQSPYSFLHPYATMRIGGALEFRDGARSFLRVKRPQNSLLDAHERPIADTAILSELGGVDRDAYRTMFSLDDATLEEGGESILQARGDLGQLLFSGSSGLADLGRRILDLRGEAEKFFRPNARSGGLHDLRNELEALKAEKDRIDTQASKHAELAEAARRAGQDYDNATRERAALQQRRDEIQRLLEARPRLTKLRALRDRLAPLEEAPEPPAEWADQLPGLREEAVRLETQIAAHQAEILRLTEKIDGLALDDAALALAGPDEPFELRGRYVTAVKDIPRLRDELRDKEFAIAAHLRQIGRDGEADPRRLALPAATAQSLRELIETRSGLEAASAASAAELAAARQQLEMAGDELAKTDGARKGAFSEQNLAELMEALAACRASDHAARRRLAEKALRAAQAALDDGLAALAPWRGEADELHALTTPEPEQFLRWRTTEQELLQKKVGQDAEIERLISLQRRHAAEYSALTGAAAPASDEDAAALRAERDRAWADHRSRLDSGTADRFEQALRRDDQAVAQRFAHVAELARLREAATAMKIVESDLVRATELRAKTRAEADDFAGAVTRAVGALSDRLPLDWTWMQLEGWLARRARALDARATLRAAEDDLRAAVEDAAAFSQRLGRALAAVGTALAPEPDEIALVAAAQAVVDQEAGRRRLRQDVENRTRDLALREKADKDAARDKRLWDDAWARLCAACWLGEGGTPTLAAARSVLGINSELEAALDARQALIGRIEGMERDQAAFRDEVFARAGRLGFEFSMATPVDDLGRRIADRIRQAQADRDERAKEIRRLEDVREDLRELAKKQGEHDRRKLEMTGFFGVSTLAEVSQKLGDAALRKGLRRDAAEEAEAILAALRAATLQEAEAALDSADLPALELERAGLAARLEMLEQQSRDSYAALKLAERQVEAIGGDARVAELEERRRTVLLEIEDGARRHLRLRAGAIATEQALRLYRERHRSSMMARASEALATISRGAYARLTAQPEKESEILVAIAADNSSKRVTEMSKGTRFQLYLALRVAGYFEFAKTRTPVPFIADDIMETFDDFRAEEAFRLFAGMAETGQVIYLTHHRHLCEIARQVCPQAKLHELPPALSAAPVMG